MPRPPWVSLGLVGVYAALLVFSFFDSVIPTGAAASFAAAERRDRGKISAFSAFVFVGPADRGGPLSFFRSLVAQPFLAVLLLHIFSGASIPKSPNANTNCCSTNSVNPSRNARFSSSASDKIWCL